MIQNAVNFTREDVVTSDGTYPASDLYVGRVCAPRYTREDIVPRDVAMCAWSNVQGNMHEFNAAGAVIVSEHVAVLCKAAGIRKNVYVVTTRGVMKIVDQEKVSYLEVSLEKVC